MGSVKKINSDIYNETIASGLVVIDFYADWCGPCNMMAPVFEETAKDYEGRVVFAKMNTDENQDIAMRNGIMSIPTMMFFKDGKLFDRVVGYIDKGTLCRKVDALL